VTLSTNKPEYTGIPDNSGGGSVTTKDEGSTVVATTTTLNFVGAGVTATDGGGGTATVTIPGGSAALDLTTVGGSVIVYKSADEIVNNSAALQDDDHLIVAVLTGQTYFFDVFLRWNANASGGLSVAIGGTATSSSARDFSWALTQDADDVIGVNVTTTIGDGSPLNTSSVYGFMRHRGYFVCNGSGNLIVRWAQVTAHLSNTTVGQGSHMFVQRIA
jgi:hypothetical protein